MDKRFFEPEFTDPGTVDIWDEIYDRQDFLGDCYRQRMGIVASWLEDLRLPQNSRILDAGCGAGRFARIAAQKAYSVIALDYSRGMLTRADETCNEKDGLRVGFVEGTIETLPFQISSLDMIVCLGVIGYLKSEDKALKEFVRVLRPGGVLAISIINKARLAHRLDLPLLLATIPSRVADWTSRMWTNGSHMKDRWPFRTFFIPKFKKSLELAGFEVLKYQTVPWKMLTFWGKELLPPKISTRIALFLGRATNVPIVGSFGGMCVIEARKNSSENPSSGRDAT